MKIKNLPLILGLTIPALMIIFIAIAVYIPPFFVKMNYDILYITPNDYDCPKIFYLSGSKLYLQDNPNTYYREHNSCNSQAFIYDVFKEESRQIPLEEAESLNVFSETSSPDGFEIISGGYNGGFFPFYYNSNDYGSKYVQGHGISKKIKIQSSGNYKDFRIIGWVNK